MAPKATNQHIQVAVRLRPLNAQERKQGSYSIVDMDGTQKSVSVKSSMNQFASNQKVFSYDHVFNQQTKQVEVYKTVVAPALNEVLMGYNCTIFAYGQTGSGKTFTMEGERTEDTDISWEEDPLAGIIPRTLHHLFSRLQKQECEFSVRVSFLEIYNEELIDLLGAESVENPRLKIYEDASKKGSCVISGLEEVVVHNKDEVYAILENGTNKRQTAATLLNAQSSRSHSVFMITVHIKENTMEGEELLKTGKLNLVDLAGSECIGRSGAVEKRAREAGNINQSLLTLGRCITALVEHAPHVPFRESKLTRLLQDSLGGRTKTSIIATVSPASCNLEETISTLEYAHRAKSITNKPEINQKLTKRALIKEYTEEIEKLRRDLQAARDKNGIFLASENYEKMLNTDAAQKAIIRDLEEKIDYITKEMDKLSELFSDTKLELQETKGELELTTKTLEETSNTLKVTKKTLRTTKKERDEQVFLVSEHSKQEKTLYSQANQLLETVTETKGDVGALHDKVDRMRSTENQNLATQQVFHDGYIENIRAMRTNLQEFTEQHLQVKNVLRENLNAAFDERQEQLEGHVEELKSLREQQVTGLKTLAIFEEHHFKQNAQAREDLKSTVDTFQAGFIADEKAILEQNLSRLSSVQHLLEGMKLDQERNKVQVSESLEEYIRMSDEMRTKDETFLKERLQEMEQFDADYAEQLAQNEEKMKIAMAERDQYEKAQNENLLEMISTLLSKREDDDKQWRSQIFGHFTANAMRLRENVDSMLHHQTRQMTVAIDSFGERYSALFSTFKERSSTVLEAESKAMDKACELLHKKLEIVNTISTQEENRIQALTAHCESIQDSIIAQDNACASQQKERNFAITDTEQLLAISTQSLTNMLRTDCDQQSEQLESACVTLSETGAAFSNWSQCLDGALAKRDEEISNFLAEDLVMCKPTGETPQRRDFNHPHQLAKTGRHSLLLRQFRAKYVLEEAANEPLPDLSFTDDEAVDSLKDDDAAGLNLSSDSAISCANSQVSNATQGDKENMPPPTRPVGGKTSTHARGRTTSGQKSLTIGAPRDRSNSSSRGSTTSQGSQQIRQSGGNSTTPGRQGSNGTSGKKQHVRGNSDGSIRSENTLAPPAQESAIGKALTPNAGVTKTKLPLRTANHTTGNTSA